MYMAKAWVAFLGTVVTAMTAALGDDVLDLTDVQQVLVAAIPALVTLFSVYQIENRSQV